ncbi:MAG: multiprotein bridging factor aMBF1 [Sulfolobales archaeon]
MCGKEIPLRASVEVKIEGAIMRLCPSCYARYTMGRASRARQDDRARIQMSVQKPQLSAGSSHQLRQKRERIERYEIVKDYSERIRSAREAMGLSTKDLANMIRESENIVKRIESGRLVPPIDLARRIENVLKIQLVVPSVDQELEEGKTQRQVSTDLTLGDIIQIRKREQG